MDAVARIALWFADPVVHPTAGTNRGSPVCPSLPSATVLPAGRNGEINLRLPAESLVCK